MPCGRTKELMKKYHWPESGESGVNHGSNDFEYHIIQPKSI